MLDGVIRAARMLTPAGLRSGWVGVRDGAIVAVEHRQPPPEASPQIDLADDEVLLPGLVDTHIHVNEPGRTQWEGFATATAAAALGGITTVLDMPLNSIPATVDLVALETKRAAAQGNCHIDVGFWGGAVPSNLGQLRPLYEAGVFGFKCFLLDSGVPEFAPLSTAQLRAHLREIANLGSLMIVHAEDPTVIAAAAPLERGPLDPNVSADLEHRRTYRNFLASRPAQAENQAIATVLAAARDTGARVHIVHLSSAQALPLIAAAKDDGVAVTVETCPHYLTFTAEQIPDGATAFKCCPPIRESANQAALWAALESGLIDAVVSDHSPAPADLKCLDTGDLVAAWGGIASVQVSFPATWTAAAQRGFSLEQVVGWMASAPAGIVGLNDRAKIAVGAQADLVAFAPQERWRVDAAALKHRHRLTPYAGAELTGRVRRTWLRGHEALANNDGRLLRRSC